MKRLFTLLAAGALASACGSDNNSGGNVVNVDPTMGESAISAAFSGAAENSVIQMAAGTYHFTNTLNLAAKNNITVKGAGMTSTILDFATQTGGADGISQSVPSGTVKVSFQDFSIQDIIGNGIKVMGATDGVHVNHVGVSWPTRPVHGGYGIYPVQSKKILVENCLVDGASDTGIYVGQSDMIVVRNNEVKNNVAGIEIENSFNADVTGNNSHDNTVGFLAFDLPDLQQVGGHNIRVYGNQFVNNNTSNFALGGTVALVPAGTGGAVMANSEVEVFQNTFTGNTTAGFAVISCFTGIDPSPTGQCVANTNYHPFPGNVWVHDNTFSGNGATPLAHNQDMNHPSFALAYLLQTGFPASQGAPGWLDGHVADVLWDGVVGLAGGGNPFSICSQNNTDATYHFANLHLQDVDLQNPDLSTALQNDDGAFNCKPQGFPLSPVPVPTF